LRALFLVTARPEPPRWLARLLPHVGPAVLAAITVPALLAPHGTTSPAEVAVGLVAAVAAWALWRRTRSLPVALFGGFAVSWAAAWLLT
jgi:branched-subunit amino acid transport protein